MKNNALLERLPQPIPNQFKNNRFIFIFKDYEKEFRFKILNCNFSNSAQFYKLSLHNFSFENKLNAMLYVFLSNNDKDYQIFDKYFSHPTNEYCAATFFNIDLHKYQNNIYYYLYKDRSLIHPETIDIDDKIDYHYYSKTLAGINKVKFFDVFYDDCDYGIFFKDANGKWKCVS